MTSGRIIYDKMIGLSLGGEELPYDLLEEELGGLSLHLNDEEFEAKSKKVRRIIWLNNKIHFYNDKGI